MTKMQAVDGAGRAWPVGLNIKLAFQVPPCDICDEKSPIMWRETNAAGPIYCDRHVPRPFTSTPAPPIGPELGWEAEVSDVDPVTGLVSACQLCGIVPLIDYLVDDDYWEAVVPGHLRRGVICLPCLMDRAGRDAFDHVGLLYLTIDGVTRAFTATTEHRAALASELARREAAASEADRLRRVYGKFRDDVDALVFPPVAAGGHSADEIIERVRALTATEKLTFDARAAAQAEDEALEDLRYEGDE